VSKEKETKTVRIVTFPEPSARSQTHEKNASLKTVRFRTREELAPLAQQISENVDLMQRFRAVAGSEDPERGGNTRLNTSRIGSRLRATCA
jgi:hypothetical protein